LGIGVLEDEPYSLASPVDIPPCDGLTLDFQFALVRGKQPVAVFEQGRFPRAIGPTDGNDFFLVNRELDVVNTDRPVGIRMRLAGEIEQCHPITP
jgi:hypothetical protein